MKTKAGVPAKRVKDKAFDDENKFLDLELSSENGTSVAEPRSEGKSSVAEPKSDGENSSAEPLSDGESSSAEPQSEDESSAAELQSEEENTAAEPQRDKGFAEDAVRLGDIGDSVEENMQGSKGENTETEKRAECGNSSSESEDTSGESDEPLSTIHMKKEPGKKIASKKLMGLKKTAESNTARQDDFSGTGELDSSASSALKISKLSVPPQDVGTESSESEDTSGESDEPLNTIRMKKEPGKKIASKKLTGLKKTADSNSARQDDFSGTGEPDSSASSAKLSAPPQDGPTGDSVEHDEEPKAKKQRPKPARRAKN
ncbi:hypothetical protein V5799_000062 [Amblyomma americanum]|uniref:Uncharacterized protein n=1 Tax=Amblyomma americanum TaxID=6943 RepID=A0AAQ4D446_AMBAM